MSGEKNFSDGGFKKKGKSIITCFPVVCYYQFYKCIWVITDMLFLNSGGFWAPEGFY
jgi:hypothetical protein